VLRFTLYSSLIWSWNWNLEDHSWFFWHIFHMCLEISRGIWESCVSVEEHLKELYCPCTVLGLWKTCGVAINSYCNKSMCGQITWTHDGWNHTKYILQWDNWTEISSLLHAFLNHLNNFFPTLQCHNLTIIANDNECICGFCFWTTRTTLSIIKQDMPAIDVGITSILFYVLFEILEFFVGNSMISWIFLLESEKEIQCFLKKPPDFYSWFK
jgi:hypothetical protein